MSDRKEKEQGLTADPKLREQLHQLMDSDLDRFLDLLGADRVQIFVCMEQMAGRSYQQIANKLGARGIKMTRYAVRDRCKSCVAKPTR